MISERETTVIIALNRIFIRNNASSIDLAEYTEAKERITLGKKARKSQANKQKATIAELIDEAYVVRKITWCTVDSQVHYREEDDDDDEMKDWENSQLRRSGLSTKEPETPSPVRDISSPYFGFTYSSFPGPHIQATAKWVAPWKW
jgi:hypothetical protein